MQFEQHGHFELWQSNNILCARLYGTWNQIAAERFAEELKKQVNHMPKPWGHLVYLSDWELCSPDVFPVIAELVNWCIENDLTKVANVYVYSYIKEGFVNKMVVEQQDEFERVVFDNDKEAIDWLSSKGFILESNNSYA